MSPGLSDSQQSSHLCGFPFPHLRNPDTKAGPGAEDCGARERSNHGHRRPTAPLFPRASAGLLGVAWEQDHGRPGASGGSSPSRISVRAARAAGCRDGHEGPPWGHGPVCWPGPTEMTTREAGERAGQLCHLCGVAVSSSTEVFPTAKVRTNLKSQQLGAACTSPAKGLSPKLSWGAGAGGRGWESAQNRLWGAAGGKGARGRGR